MNSDKSRAAARGAPGLRSWLLGLYPHAWRDRYGEEFEILLEQCLHSPLDVLDIFLGALDAHLEFPIELNWSNMNITNKLRTSVFIVFAAYIGFIVGGLSLYGLVDDSPAIALLRAHGALYTAWTTVQVGAVVALLAVVLGALPLAIASIRRALSSSRKDLRLLLVPVWAFVALLLYGVFMAGVANGSLHIEGVVAAVSPDTFPLGNRLLLAGLMLVFILGAVASTAAVGKVLANGDAAEASVGAAGSGTSTQLYRFAYPPAIAATLSMLLMLIATLAFGWLAYTSLPQWFQGNNGLLLLNTTLSFALTVIIMALSAAAAVFGVTRGYGFWKSA